MTSHSSYIIRGGAGFFAFRLPHPTHSRESSTKRPHMAGTAGMSTTSCRTLPPTHGVGKVQNHCGAANKAKGRNLIHCNVTSPCPLHLWVASSFSFQKICTYATASHATRPPHPLPTALPYPIHQSFTSKGFLRSNAFPC